MSSTFRPTARFALLLPFVLALSLLSLVAVHAQEPASPAVMATSEMSADEAIAKATDPDGVLRFDVAENATQWIIDPDVVTTQLYNFGGTYGEALLVSDGYELADVGVAIDRALTGGTGHFLGADGAATQIFLGFNETMGVNLTFEIQVVS